MPTQPSRRQVLSSRAQRGICFLFFLCALTSTAPTAQTLRPKILGIRSARISCDEACGGEAFYSRLLPLSGDCRWCGRVPGTNIGRAQTPFWVNDDQEVLLTKSSPSPDPAGLAEIVFATNDVNAFEEYLHTRGVKVARVKNGAGIALDDPDGHHIQFQQKTDRRMNYSHKFHGMRLIHAGFIVRDQAAMDHFYKDILGFRPYWHGGMKDDETSWISLQVPDGTDWVEFMVNLPPNPDQHLRGVMNHIALGVVDIHATREQLVKNGVHLTEEPKLGRDGKWQLNLYDPDQTRVEFMEFTPKEKPCCSEFTGPHPKP